MKIAEKRRPPGKDHLTLYNQQQKDKEKKLQQAKELQQQKEIEECTFTPTLIASSNPKMPPKIELNVDYANFISDI